MALPSSSPPSVLPERVDPAINGAQFESRQAAAVIGGIPARSMGSTGSPQVKAQIAVSHRSSGNTSSGSSGDTSSGSLMQTDSEGGFPVIPALRTARTDAVHPDAEVADLVAQWSALALTNEAEKSLVALDVSGSALRQTIPQGGGLLLGSLYSIRPFNPKALERMMVSVWRPVYGVQMEEVEPNLQMFSFGNKVDLARVFVNGPWRFDDHFLLLKEISDPSQSDRELLQVLPIWVQMYDVPLM